MDFPTSLLSLKTLQGQMTESMTKNDGHMARVQAKLEQVLNENLGKMDADIAALHSEIAAAKKELTEVWIENLKQERRNYADQNAKLEERLVALGEVLQGVQTEFQNGTKQINQNSEDLWQEVRRFLKRTKITNAGIQDTVTELSSRVQGLVDAHAAMEEGNRHTEHQIDKTLHAAAQACEASIQTNRGKLEAKLDELKSYIKPNMMNVIA